jgi:beta-phosphoglucomutase-like phosphatase (HAD superfamily)
MFITSSVFATSSRLQEMIGSGEVEPRPGVLRLMDEAREAGLKVAVCSAATKSSVVFTLTSLLGKQRFEELDCFLAGEGARPGRGGRCYWLTSIETLS